MKLWNWIRSLFGELLVSTFKIGDHTYVVYLYDKRPNLQSRRQVIYRNVPISARESRLFPLMHFTNDTTLCHVKVWLLRSLAYRPQEVSGGLSDEELSHILDGWLPLASAFYCGSFFPQHVDHAIERYNRGEWAHLHGYKPKPQSKVDWLHCGF